MEDNKMDMDKKAKMDVLKSIREMAMGMIGEGIDSGEDTPVVAKLEVEKTTPVEHEGGFGRKSVDVDGEEEAEGDLLASDAAPTSDPMLNDTDMSPEDIQEMITHLQAMLAKKQTI